MLVVGRLKEIEVLKQSLKSSRSELIAVYGRRRIGKTYLIGQVYGKHIYFEITGLHNGTLSDQLQHFSKMLAKQWKAGNKLQKPENWFEAFDQLEAFINASRAKSKKVIFIDEFPWMDTPRSKFLMAFENFWNSFAAKRNDLVVVICGSAAAYMVKNIVKNRGGLHNRITQHLRLAPFSLYETEQFLKYKGIKFTRYDVLQLYMAIGGVPHYLDKIKPGQSVHQAIDNLCFSTDGDLVDEFENIFKSLYVQHQKHMAIVATLAQVKKGLSRNDILQKSKLASGGTFSKTLDELIESGFVSQYLPYKKKAKDALYRLTDEYTLFYAKFMSSKKRLGAGTWLNLFKSQSYASWCGIGFESVCLKHVRQIKQALGIAAIYSEDVSWTNPNAQIDLLLDRDDNVVTICEMKFYNKPFAISKQYGQELRNKLNVFEENMMGRRKNVFLCLITANGLQENEHSNALVHNYLDINALFIP